MKFLTVVGALMSASTIVESAKDEMCLLPVDVVILQDTTGSFVDDLPNVTAILPKLVDDILVQNPGSMFAVTDFKDKPYRDLGEPSDHCYQLWSPLSDDKEVFCKAFGQLYASGGGDKPEAQLQALINVVQDKAVGWRRISDAFKSQGTSMDLVNETGARLIIMSTDATPHDPKDYEFYNGSMEDDFTEEPRPPKFMPDFPNDPMAVGVSPDTQCRVYDYPFMEQAAKIITANKVNVVMLVPENEPEALAKWNKFNKMLGQPDSFVQYISTDSSDAADVILKAMSEVSEYVCNQSTTTTPAPVTTAPTTVPTTVATTVPTTVATTVPTTVATTVATTAPTTVPTTVAPVTTVATTVPATTTGASVSTAGSTQSVSATTMASTTTPAGQTTPECPECPTCPECPPCDHSPCPPCPHPCPPCECPEVVIKLRHRPAKLHFKIQNEHE